MTQEIKSASTIKELAAIVDKLDSSNISEQTLRAVQETLNNLTEQALYNLKNDADKLICDKNLSEVENFIKSESSKLQDEIKSVITDDYALLNRVNSRADEIINSCSENLKRMTQQIISAQSVADIKQFAAAKNPVIAQHVGEFLTKFVNAKLEKLQNDINSLIMSKKFNEAESLINSEGAQLKQDILNGDSNLINKVNNLTQELTKKVFDAKPGFARALFTFILVVAIIAGGVYLFDNYYNDGQITQNVKDFVMELSSKLNTK